MNINTLPSSQILTGEGQLLPGRSTTITTDGMASRSLKWLRIEEFSVELFPEPSSIFTPDFPLVAQAMGSFLGIKPTAYRLSLSNDFVPVWLLGPRTAIQTEKVQKAIDVNAGVGIPYGPYESYRWKFSTPFYLPPGAAFLVQVQRNGNALDLAYNVAINIRIVVRASQMSEKEARARMLKQGGNPLPYAAAFVPTSYPAQSSDLTFKNPFPTPLHVQRLTGRCAGFYDQMVYVQNQGGVDGNNNAIVQLWDNRTLISEKIPFNLLFPPTTMAWNFTRSLKQNQYLTARLYTNDAAQCQPQVGMVGYRNEEIP